MQKNNLRKTQEIQMGIIPKQVPTTVQSGNMMTMVGGWNTQMEIIHIIHG